MLEHIADLDMFFTNISRLLAPSALLCISDVHWLKASKGSLARYKRDESEKWLDSRAHPEERVIAAAANAGLTLKDSYDAFGTEELKSAFSR